MKDAAFVLLQHLLPHHLLSRAAGRIADLRGGAVTRQLIRRFAHHYEVDLGEAREPDPDAYATFTEFFTRALRDGARPIADAPLVSPADGVISQCGRIRSRSILQAKGAEFDVAALLGGLDSAPFHDGSFATIYLSPRDYHRVHVPAAGRAVEWAHVPGRLFSVNAATARGVPRLFARNERLAVRFDTAFGPLAMVLVGAMIVGRIRTVITGPLGHPDRVRRETAIAPPAFAAGDEFGRFLLGSTVIVCTPRGGPPLRTDLAPGHAVRMGRALCDPDGGATRV